MRIYARIAEKSLKNPCNHGTICAFQKMPKAFLTTALCAALLVGCIDYDRRLTDRNVNYPVHVPSTLENDIAESKSYWDGDGLPGAPSIIINLSRQTASFYKGDTLAGVSAISSGREGYKTPPGNYKILEKKVHHVSGLYGSHKDANDNIVKTPVSVRDPVPPGARFVGSPMPYWMRMSNSGIGMHQGFLPGVPDSHGCIRLPERMAKAFFANVEKGTPVTVVP